VGKQLDRYPAPRRILVQWVPHGYGYHSMNLAFCLWLWRRSARSGDKIEIMVHEAFLAFGEGSWRQDAAALVHRLMTIMLLLAAERVWVSIPKCASLWRPYALGRRIPFQWLPIPSNIPVIHDAGVEAIRRQYAPEEALLIGHFGTYGAPVANLLEPVLLRLGDFTGRILLLGIDSQRFATELIRKNPELSSRVIATGPLAPEDISRHISACDLLIQPYPDGVSSRRTSLMAGLSHGKAILTTSGDSTEPVWATTAGVAMTPAGDADAFVKSLQELCAQSGRRAHMGQAARELYREHFDVHHMIAALRQTDLRESACAY
jgi:hypothetical protein